MLQKKVLWNEGNHLVPVLQQLKASCSFVSEGRRNATRFHSCFGIGICSAHRCSIKANGATSVAGQPGPFWKEGCKEGLEKQPHCAHKGWVVLWQLWQNLSRIRKGLRLLCSACIPSLLKGRTFSENHCRHALWESGAKLIFTVNIKPTQCFSTEVTPTTKERIYCSGQTHAWFIWSAVSFTAKELSKHWQQPQASLEMQNSTCSHTQTWVQLQNLDCNRPLSNS